MQGFFPRGGVTVLSSVNNVNIRKEIAPGGFVTVSLMSPASAVREQIKKVTDGTPDTAIIMMSKKTNVKRLYGNHCHIESYCKETTTIKNTLVFICTCTQSIPSRSQHSQPHVPRWTWRDSWHLM